MDIVQEGKSKLQTFERLILKLQIGINFAVLLLEE